MDTDKYNQIHCKIINQNYQNNYDQFRSDLIAALELPKEIAERFYERCYSEGYADGLHGILSVADDWLSIVKDAVNLHQR